MYYVLRIIRYPSFFIHNNEIPIMKLQINNFILNNEIPDLGYLIEIIIIVVMVIVMVIVIVIVIVIIIVIIRVRLVVMVILTTRCFHKFISKPTIEKL